jgi:hypothetical protein
MYRGKARSIVLAPLDIPDIAQQNSVQIRYREILTQALTKLGFQVVGDQMYASLWAQEKATVEGFYDPYTGARDESKIAAARARIFANMREKFGAAAVAFPSIVVRQTLFEDAGGIQVLERVIGGRPSPVPEAELFQIRPGTREQSILPFVISRRRQLPNNRAALVVGDRRL